MQVMQHGGVPFQQRGCKILGDLKILAHAVAIIVVLHILAPVHQRRPLLASLLTVVIGVHLFFASVHFEHRGDEGDHVVADLLDERRLLNDQPISQLNQHFRAAGLGRMDAAVGPVEGLADPDQVARLFIGDLARIPQPGQNVLVLIQVLNRGLVGDRQNHLVAPFLGLPDLPEPGARRGLSQRFVVAVDVLGVGQLARFAGNAAQELQG